jgi:hypothetical protein
VEFPQRRLEAPPFAQTPARPASNHFPNSLFIYEIPSLAIFGVGEFYWNDSGKRSHGPLAPKVFVQCACLNPFSSVFGVNIKWLLTRLSYTRTLKASQRQIPGESPHVRIFPSEAIEKMCKKRASRCEAAPLAMRGV